MKQTGLLLVILMISIVTGLKANQVTDSLQLLFAKAQDTTTVKLPCDLCWEYRFVLAEKALEYGQEALSLSISIDYDKGIAQSYNDMGIIYIDISNYSKAIAFFENSLEIRKKLNDQSGIASAYNKIGIVYQKQGKLKNAFENCLTPSVFQLLTSVLLRRP